MRISFNRTVSGIMVVLVLLGLLSPLVNAEETITNPLNELLPPKIDNPGHDPTNPLQEPEWYYGNSWSETLSEPGFLEGRAVGYYKRFFVNSDMSLEFYVYRFSNVSSAEAYCIKEVNQIKSQGGYTEVPISDAFAVVYDYGTQEIGISWGVVYNIVFKVGVYTANIVEDPTDQLVTFTLYEREHILGTSVIIPEIYTIVSYISAILISLGFAILLGVTKHEAKKKRS